MITKRATASGARFQSDGRLPADRSLFRSAGWMVSAGRTGGVSINGLTGSEPSEKSVCAGLGMALIFAAPLFRLFNTVQRCVTRARRKTSDYPLSTGYSTEIGSKNRLIMGGDKAS